MKDEIKQAVERDLLEVSGRKRDLHRRADTTLTNTDDAAGLVKKNLLVGPHSYASSSCNGIAVANTHNTAFIGKKVSLQVEDNIPLSRNQH